MHSKANLLAKQEMTTATPLLSNSNLTYLALVIVWYSGFCSAKVFGVSAKQVFERIVHAHHAYLHRLYLL